MCQSLQSASVFCADFENSLTLCLSDINHFEISPKYIFSKVKPIRKLSEVKLVTVWSLIVKGNLPFTI